MDPSIRPFIYILLIASIKSMNNGFSMNIDKTMKAILWKCLFMLVVKYAFSGAKQYVLKIVIKYSDV